VNGQVGLIPVGEASIQQADLTEQVALQRKYHLDQAAKLERIENLLNANPDLKEVLTLLKQVGLAHY
jgi:hypothetical protein